MLPHAANRMTQRGVLFRQVLRVIKAGAIVEGPYLGQHGDWRVDMQGRPAGSLVTVALAIKWRTRLLVVTVIKDDAA